MYNSSFLSLAPLSLVPVVQPKLFAHTLATSEEIMAPFQLVLSYLDNLKLRFFSSITNMLSVVKWTLPPFPSAKLTLHMQS